MSTPDRKPRLLTERAVFRPRIPQEPIHSEPSSVRPDLETNRPHTEYAPLTSGEYRVPILFVGREELMAVLPEHQAQIRQLSDLEIEALALQVEACLAEFCRLALRLTWSDFLSERAQNGEALPPR